MEAEHTQVVTRIGFAERWLHRARAQCADGDVAGGLLTLALADAEVRYALETAGARMPRHAAPVRRRHPARWLTAAAAVVGAAAWLSMNGIGAADVVTADGPPVVRFARVGSLLASMSVPLPAAVDEESAVAAGTTVPSRTAAGRTGRIGVRVPQPAPRAASTIGPSPASRASPTGSTTVPAATPAPAAPSAPPSWIALSDADLIEMVIAASRALQGTGP